MSEEKQLDRTQRPPVQAIGELALPQIHTEILCNGLTFNVLQGGIMDVNQLVLTWPGGTCERPSKLVPFLTGILLKEGAAGLKGEEISERIDFNGARCVPEVGQHHSAITLTMLNRFTDGLLPLLSDIIEKPDFPGSAFQVYLNRLYHNQKLQEQQVGYAAQRCLLELMAGPNHRLAHNLDDEDFKNVNREDLFAFHQEVYQPGACHAFLSGKISDDLQAEVKAMLQSWQPGGSGCPLCIQPFDTQEPQIVRVEKPDAQQSAVRIALPAPERSHPDYIPLRFAVMALGGYFGSRLMKNVREDKGYTYGIHAYLSGSLDGSMIVVSADCAAQYVEPLIEETRKEMLRMANEPMGEEELGRLRMHIGADLMETLDNAFSIMDYYRVMYALRLPEGYFESQVNLARSLRPEDLMEAARKWLVPDRMRIAIAGPKAD